MILEDQALLFSLLHDGTIEDITTIKNGVRFSVDIKYLAEKINPMFNHIVIQLIYLEDFYFKASDSNVITYDYQKHNSLNLEILKTDACGDRIKVFCSANQGNTLGFLNIKVKQIELYDSEGIRIELSKLESLCKEYWDDLGL
ncbi:hypothetical protein [Paenibacillus sp. PL91]|uniref:hypothetical protein n=1 Tax=Paenibacillus sp. PL91 TaxID=2729538 RepID=UPI00145CF862|nr:hypothetical protein [Paenibacillus sp. PL91]MBC9204666.1 hypothetical protein [Paenibacillus sp. PL91]